MDSRAKTSDGIDEKSARIQLFNSLRAGAGIETPRGIERRCDSMPAPLSFAQERLWFLDQLQPGGVAYHICRAQRLRGALDVAALERALNRVVARHEVLRTRFRRDDDRPVQIVSDSLTLPIPVEQTSARDPAQLAWTMSQEAERPFDLSSGPLLRMALFKLARDEYGLVLTAHQIVFDGWSIGLFFKELGALYEEERTGRPAALPLLPVQYADYAAWQRERVESERLEAQLRFWKGRLGGTLPMLALPARGPRPPLQRHRGARCFLTIPRPIGRGLLDIARRSGATLFEVLMAAFNVLLHRYSGQSDIVVGFPVANRERTEVENLIGFFVNTLALRGDLSGDPRFCDWLQRLRGDLRQAYENRALPFEKLVEELGVERDLSRNPIFQAMFAYQNEAPPLLELPGVAAEPIDAHAGGAKFDLMLSLARRGQELGGFFEYDADLFEAPCIDRMAGHWQTLLRGIAAEPEQRLSKLPLLTPKERRRLLTCWSPTRLDGAQELCIHQMFEAQVERTPDAIAVEHNGERLTYRDLNRRANRLARQLRFLGVGPERRVGVWVERGFDLIASLIGVLKAGGAYVPIDPAYPRERIAFMVQDAGISVLITQSDLLAARKWRAAARERRRVLFHSRLELLCLDRDAGAIGHRRASNPNFKVAWRNLAYVIYTSGSTGRPKGVAVEHRNATALLGWARTEYNRADLAGVLASTSVSFDLSVFEIFLPLSVGGSVILVEDALGLRSCAAKNRVTLVNTVPSVMRELLAAGGLPPSVRVVNLAGEPLSAELVRWVYQAANVQRVYDLYGPTETTTYSTFALRAPESRATIGRPIANTKVYILDANFAPAPVGIPGEIFIGGAGVARGYWKRPELTRERFLPDPFAQGKSARVYRTGDLGRYLDDGNIEYLGRADQQVKIRGHRIEPGEIEAALNSHPAIAESIVAARERETSDLAASKNAQFEIGNPKSEKRLVAYLVCKGDTLPDVSELRSFLGEKLPEFMVPETFVRLDRLPLGANGKIDRSALPAPKREGAPGRAVFARPRTEIEELIAETWCEALGLERVGVNENFFELGGHSLLAARVAARLRASFSIEIELRKLFELPTIAELARHVENLRRASSRNPLPALAAGAARERAPLSFAQRRLWFLHRLDPDLTAYNMPAAYRIKGPLKRAAFESALKHMVERHESLRTAIVEIDGEPVQRIFRDVKVEIPLVDLSGCAGPEIDAEIRRRLNRDARRPFDLERAPLMRLGLLRFARDDHALLINFHHIVADAASLSIFYRELAALYEAALNKNAAKLPALTVRYADFAAWQRDWACTPGFKAELAYWKKQLGESTAPPSLPVDFERSDPSSARAARLSRRLSADLTKEIKSLGRRCGATLFMTLLAALKLLLARLSGREDVVVGAAVAGRARAELEGVVGFFINALALRTDLSGNPTFVELLGRVREVCLDAFSRQDMPFERIVEELNPSRHLGRNPIFQVLFNMNDLGERDLKLAGCEVRKIGPSSLDAKFDLVVQAPQIDGCIELSMVYNAGLFSQARIAALLDQWGFLLEQIAADPAKPFDRYSLLTPQSKKFLPDPTETLDDTWHGAIQSFVAREAEQKPDRAAIVDDRSRWSYDELDRASSRLANYLIAAGVARGDVAAIYAHRDATLAMALLGVLKAGGVFVIFDPAYPPARLAQYWRMARPKALLQMEGAGALPDALERCCEEGKIGARWVLPAIKAEVFGRLEQFSDRAPPFEARADEPAYIAFTSGSTGEPKGVLCRHGPITHFLPWQQAAFDLRKSDRYGLLSGLAYNHLHRDLFTALAGGATVFVPTSDCLKEPARLVGWLAEREITIVHLTPALGRLLCGIREKLPALRRIFFGGDVLTWADARAMHALAPNAEMISFYGATETQRAVGYFSIPGEMFAGKNRSRRTVPTGRGVPDVQLLCLTANGQLAGIGEIGELYVRSPHLAGGYIDDPALTEATFVVNPFTGRADDRLYRTGEYGRYAPGGDVEWAGRGERRANIRGFRVALAEIESTIKRFSGVKDCAVAIQGFAADTEAGAKAERLAAYIEPAPDAKLDLDELRWFVSQRLPQYMVPAHFLLLERLPLGANGKIDYRALPAPPAERSTRPFEAPQGALEQALSEILASLLGMERLGRHDDFFDLGGHSLLAARAVARIGEKLRARLEVRALFESPTVAALARRIEAARSGASSPKTDDGEREEIEL